MKCAFSRNPTSNQFTRKSNTLKLVFRQKWQKSSLVQGAIKIIKLYKNHHRKMKFTEIFV